MLLWKLHCKYIYIWIDLKELYKSVNSSIWWIPVDFVPIFKLPLMLFQIDFMIKKREKTSLPEDCKENIALRRPSWVQYNQWKLENPVHSQNPWP